MRVIVVGAGIGGLTAALTLRRAGIDAQVFEQATELREVGAGIQISPNGTRILHRLGLAETLRKVAVRPVAVEVHRWDDGRVLTRQLLADVCERNFGAPYYHLHRADLLDVLAEALPTSAIHLDHRCVGLIQHADKVELKFHNGLTADADVVVGAGGRYMNWVAIACGEWRIESWTARGEVADALKEFAGWHPQIGAIIGAADTTNRWALYDRDPLPRWTVGRVALIGDAAHAMLPYMAQGAVQSIEDAAVLAKCLERADVRDVGAVLRRYEEIRKPRASRCQAGSRSNGVMYHWADGEEQRKRDSNLGAAATAPLPQNSWLYGHDVEAELNR